MIVETLTDNKKLTHAINTNRTDYLKQNINKRF